MWLLIAVMIGFLVFVIVSMTKEKSIVGFYKAQGLFGRAYAYFFSGLFYGGIISIIMCIILEIDSKKKNVPMLIAQIAVEIVAIFIGVMMFRRVQKKCPGELRKRLFLDLSMAGLGFIGRVGFFIVAIFFHTWFVVNKPTEYVVDGRTVYAYPGSNDLYDAAGNKVGVANDDYSKAYMR